MRHHGLKSQITNYKQITNPPARLHDDHAHAGPGADHHCLCSPCCPSIQTADHARPRRRNDPSRHGLHARDSAFLQEIWALSQTRVEELENTNNLRFLRKRYTDPMNRDRPRARKKISSSASAGHQPEFNPFHLSFRSDIRTQWTHVWRRANSWCRQHQQGQEHSRVLRQESLQRLAVHLHPADRPRRSAGRSGVAQRPYRKYARRLRSRTAPRTTARIGARFRTEYDPERRAAAEQPDSGLAKPQPKLASAITRQAKIGIGGQSPVLRRVGPGIFAPSRSQSRT
jgi:hypothetical protein